MRKWPFAGVALLAVGAFGPASAADIPVKPPVRPVLESGWGGPYGGIALGGKLAPPTWTTTSTSGFPGTTIDASSPARFHPAAARVGGYAGDNWQLSAIGVGIDGDIAYASGTTTIAGIPGCAISCFPGAFGPGVDTSSV